MVPPLPQGMRRKQYHYRYVSFFVIFVDQTLRVEALSTRET